MALSLKARAHRLPWEKFMAETAAQTNYWLDHFKKEEVLPPTWEEPFVLD